MNDIMKYHEKKRQLDKTAFEDVNAELFVSLFAIDVYGAIAYEENILQLIIGKEDDEIRLVEAQKAIFAEKLKAKEYKFDKKTGVYTDKEGCFVLRRN